MKFFKFPIKMENENLFFFFLKVEKMRGNKKKEKKMKINVFNEIFYFSNKDGK